MSILGATEAVHPFLWLPVMATQVNEDDGYLMRAAGFGPTPLVILTNLVRMDSEYDPYSWATTARTIPQAHIWITEHFNELTSGDVVDIEFILGETPVKKISQSVSETNIVRELQEWDRIIP